MPAALQNLSLIFVRLMYEVLGKMKKVYAYLDAIIFFSEDIGEHFHIYYNKVVTPVCLFVCSRTPPRFLEIDPITIYILKLHDPKYLDKYISFPKGVSHLKVQENASHPS